MLHTNHSTRWCGWICGIWREGFLSMVFGERLLICSARWLTIQSGRQELKHASDSSPNNQLAITKTSSAWNGNLWRQRAITKYPPSRLILRALRDVLVKLAQWVRQLEHRLLSRLGLGEEVRWSLENLEEGSYAMISPQNISLHRHVFLGKNSAGRSRCLFVFLIISNC